MTGSGNKQTGMWELDLNNPNISPWHPPPIASENLMLDEPQDLHKFATEEQKFYPLKWTHKNWSAFKSN